MAQMIWPTLLHSDNDLFTKQTNGGDRTEDCSKRSVKLKSKQRHVLRAKRAWITSSSFHCLPPPTPISPSEPGLDRFVCAAPIKRLAGNYTRHRRSRRVCGTTVRMRNVGVSHKPQVACVQGAFNSN